MSIKVLDYIKEKTIDFVLKTTKEVCEEVDLIFCPLNSGNALQFVAKKEKCNLEYPLKKEKNHFNSGLSSYLQLSGDQLLLMLKPDNRVDETVSDTSINLTEIDALLSNSGTPEVWKIRDPFLMAYYCNEGGLNKFKK